MTYIPNDNSTGAPSHAGLDVLRQRDVVVQELEKEVGLFFLVPDDIAGDWIVSEIIKGR